LIVYYLPTTELGLHLEGYEKQIKKAMHHLIVARNISRGGTMAAFKGPTEMTSLNIA